MRKSTIIATNAPMIAGALGALHHKGLGLHTADRDRIAAELGGGKAAVGVPCSRT